MNEWELDKLYDKKEVVSTYNMNLEDRMVASSGFHRRKDAFVIVAFVVDNDDDENDLVRNRFRLIHECAKLEFEL